MTAHDDRDDEARPSPRSGSTNENSSSARGSCGHDRAGGARHRHRRRHAGRKERVLHTRISEQLSEDIRRLAEDLRVPTSNLVRNVLEEVFTMVESVSEDVGEIFDQVLDEAEGARDRIRRRSDRSRRGAHRRRRPSRDRARGEQYDQAVEDELRRDEAAGASRDPHRAERPVEDVATPEPRERPEFPEVLGWQPLVLNRDQTCASCSVDLPRGARAYVGLGESGMLAITLCRACTGIR